MGLCPGGSAPTSAGPAHEPEPSGDTWPSTSRPPGRAHRDAAAGRWSSGPVPLRSSCADYAAAGWPGRRHAPFHRLTEMTWHVRGLMTRLDSRAGEGSPTGGDGAISFAAEVKSELAGLTPARPCCQLSELLGIFYASRGRLIRSGDGQAAYFPLLRNTVARKVVRLARLLGGMEAKYQAVRSAKQMSFFIELPLPRDLERCFCQPAAKACPSAPCDRKAMLRGIFMGCGSVNAPSARYHLELVAPTPGWATALVGLIHEQGIRAGLTERANHQVVYLKE